MKLKWEHIALLCIFIASVFLRLFFALKTPYFSDDNSYLVLRQSEHISKTGRLLTKEELSYGGRTFALMPFFYYIIAGFTLFLNPVDAGKIIPNVLISTAVFAIYLVSFEITKNKWSALISAILTAFTPITIFETINSISVYSLTIPLTFFSVYFLLKIDQEKQHVNLLVLILFMLILSDSMSSVLIVGLIIYLIICYIEKIKKSASEIELILFSIFLFLWANFIIFKKAFQAHGIEIIWNNAPIEIINRIFARITLVESIYLIGIIPLIFGSIIIYNYLFKIKNQSLYLIIAICFSSFLMSWLKLINITAALIFLSASLAVLVGQFTKDIILYIRKTKFAGIERFFLISFIVLIFLSSLIPAYFYANYSFTFAPDNESIYAFKWLNENTETNATILSATDDGNLITYFGRRKNVIDSNFLFIPNIGQRAKDIHMIYSTKYLINALNLLEKYNVNYIMITDNVKAEYNITSLLYVEEDCFDLVYNSTIQIYEKTCTIENEE